VTGDPSNEDRCRAIAAALNGIESVKKNAPDATTEDQT
jgi:uncharacterized protein YegP (UPF0339 family)